MRLDDPLLAIGVHKHDGSVFPRVPGKDLTKAWKIGAYERRSGWISSGTFRDAVLYSGVEPLRGKNAAGRSNVFAYRRHDSIISL
ncbi:MAG: hypothetical protein ACRDK4_05235 [Solirubrobacteraceae bacterium]